MVVVAVVVVHPELFCPREFLDNTTQELFQSGCSMKPPGHLSKPLSTSAQPTDLTALFLTSKDIGISITSSL